MAEIVRTYDNVKSAKTEDLEVQLLIYSDGSTREIDYASGKIVTRTNPTELFADANVRTKGKQDRIDARVNELLTAMNITQDHEEYEIAVQLARTWVSSERSDAGIRSYRELITRFGDVVTIEEIDDHNPPWHIRYKSETYRIDDGRWMERMNIDKDTLKHGLWGTTQEE